MIKIKRDRKKESTTFSINKPNSKPNFSYLLFTLCPSKQDNWDVFIHSGCSAFVAGRFSDRKKRKLPSSVLIQFLKNRIGALIQPYNNTNKDTAPIFDLCSILNFKLKIENKNHLNAVKRKPTRKGTILKKLFSSIFLSKAAFSCPFTFLATRFCPLATTQAHHSFFSHINCENYTPLNLSLWIQDVNTT